MPKCTKCNKEITSLTSIVAGVLVYSTSLDTQKDLQYDQSEFEPNTDTDIIEHLCPECNEVLFTSEAEAVDFLKGE